MWKRNRLKGNGKRHTQSFIHLLFGGEVLVVTVVMGGDTRICKKCLLGIFCTTAA